MSDYENKLNNLEPSDKALANDYFTKAAILDKLFGVVRGKFEFKNPFGNFNSKVIVVLDYNKLDDKVIKLIKKFYEINGQDFNNIYVTPYHKTMNEQINNKLLCKELEIIKPDRVLGLGIDNVNLGSESFNMNKSDFDFFNDCLGDAEKIKLDRYKAIKIIFSEIMKYAITGGK